MCKIQLPIKPLMYPLPVAVIGSMLNGRVNYMTAAYCGIINHHPPMLYISLTKTHATTEAILQTGCFSLSIPTAENLLQVDYCGITSARQRSKSAIFRPFFGRTGAPMPEECAVNIECGVADTFDLHGNDQIFAGLIRGIYADETYLTDGLPDMEKIQPLCLDSGTNRYFANGRYIAKAYQIGKNLS